MAEPPGARVYWSIGIFSAAVLAFEISLALLGFGASGTILFLLRPLVLRHVRGMLFGLIVGSAIAMPLCTALAQEVPVEARLLPTLLWKQLGCWLLFWILLALPFLLAGSAIGLALMMGGGHIPSLYGSNLLGSGAGAIGASVAMMLLPPHGLPLACGALAAIAALLLPAPRAMWRTAAIAVAVGAAGIYCWYRPPAIRTDAYKYASYVRRLENQGAAHRLATASTARSVA